ncbi:hypothetical protein RND81_02G210900 [Saponaria officinalis]|uniref:DNA-(apurinic or apyrimidinic site) lyase n=1 Tax=Saponaria officinalis TaxID=3572 RepID=A0AAW1MN29_SAPOF
MRSLTFRTSPVPVPGSNLMKRKKCFSSSPTSDLTGVTTPQTPLTLDITHLSKASETLSSARRAKRSLSQILKTQNLPKTDSIVEWVPLNLGKSELSLPLTFPTGQTFRWKKTGPLQYTGVVKSHLVSLKHLENGDVAYHIHASSSSLIDCNDAKSVLLDFLNADICLSDMWENFSASDQRFAQLAPHLAGARVLRQEPLECLIQFLCSSNNNIGRITKMVDYISSLGVFLGTVEGFNFYEFPSLECLAMVSEEEFRKAGFGYRAKYIVDTIKVLEAKPGGGDTWLHSLRKLALEEVVSGLCTLSGVGPKVAACVALFSLDQHHAVPVDTHVWQIATKYLVPELAGARLSPKLCVRVSEAFVERYGKYAGWAQTLLFVAELPSQKALISPEVSTVKQKKKTVFSKEEIE